MTTILLNLINVLIGETIDIQMIRECIEMIRLTKFDLQNQQCKFVNANLQTT